MKRKISLLAVALIATISIAFAQKNRNSIPQQKQKVCFVDSNTNGICDRYEAGVCRTGCGQNLQFPGVFGRGQGLRDGSGRVNVNADSRGRGYNIGTGRCLRDGSGFANNGRRIRYVDADNNGVCDNRETIKNYRGRK